MGQYTNQPASSDVLETFDAYLTSYEQAHLEEAEELASYLANDNYLDLLHMQQTRVLLIEDDRTTRRMVSRAVGDYCRLIEAPTAGEGVSKYKNFDPDLVFLDLELPDGNGHNILEWLTHNDPGAYVVLFSGSCDRHNVAKAMKNGAKGYIQKPFETEQMLYHICQSPKLHQ